MLRQRCCTYLLSLLVLGDLLAPLARAESPAYRLVDLGLLPGQVNAQAFATDGSQFVGDAYGPVPSPYHAMLWPGIGSTPVDLNPAGFTGSRALGVSGGQQVGWAWQGSTSNTHAFLWPGTAASAVDLTPVGFDTTTAWGIDSGRQVGSGRPLTSGNVHALMWSGTAASVIDLNPDGYGSSAAKAIHGNQIVGTVNVGSVVHEHAFLWPTPGRTGVDLHPGSAYTSSYVLGTSGAQQVGCAVKFVMPSYVPSAMLWSGTAASSVNLNPAGFSESIAVGVAQGLQVGYGYNDAYYDATAGFTPAHALLWSGTAASAIDLHPAGFLSSYASGITDSGIIVGYVGVTALNSLHAVLWVPVPEPASILLLSAGWLFLRRRVGGASRDA